MDQLMRLVDNEIMDRPTHHNTRSLFTASAHPTCIIAIIICRLKCYKGQQKQKKQQRDKRVHCTFFGIYTASQDCFCQKYVVQMILGGGRGCDGHVLQPTCFKKEMDMSRYFHNFVYSNAHLWFKNPLVLAN